jgi:hypothetical protein
MAAAAVLPATSHPGSAAAMTASRNDPVRPEVVELLLCSRHLDDLAAADRELVCTATDLEFETALALIDAERWPSCTSGMPRSTRLSPGPTAACAPPAAPGFVNTAAGPSHRPARRGREKGGIRYDHSD